MADEQEPGDEVFSWETVLGVASQMNDATLGVTDGMGLPPFMHALCLAFAAAAAQETFRRGLTAEDWAKYQKVRDLFLTKQREAFDAARAERAKKGG